MKHVELTIFSFTDYFKISIYLNNKKLFADYTGSKFNMSHMEP